MPEDKIRFNCHLCGHGVAAPVAMAGKMARCPKCKQAIAIPAASVPPGKSARAAAASTNKPAGAAPPASPPRKIPMGVLIGAGATLVVVLGVAAFLMFKGGSSPGASGTAAAPSADETPAQAFEAIRGHVERGEWGAYYDRIEPASQTQIEAMCKLMIGMAAGLAKDEKAKEEAREMGKLTGRELFVNVCSSQKDMRESFKFEEAQSVSVDGNRAKIDLKPDSKGKAGDVQMIRDNGQWKMTLNRTKSTPQSPAASPAPK